MNIQAVSQIRVKPLCHKHFCLVTQDFLFQVKEDKENFFGFLGKKNGGVSGLIIGVKDIEKSKEFYQKVLGYDIVIYEGIGKFDDFVGIKGGKSKFKRIILQQSKISDNKFKNYFGKNEIELLEVLNKDKVIDNKNNVVNPYRFGYFTADNRDIIGNYIELGYKCKSKANEKYIEIIDPDGVVISCNESTNYKKPNILDDLSIFSKITKQKL